MKVQARHVSPGSTSWMDAVVTLRDVVRAFGIEASRVRRIGHAWVNDVWMVEAGPMRYALKRVTPERTDAEVEHEHRLLDGLFELGWLVPKPIATLSGQRLIHRGGSRWWLAPWLPGRISPQHARGSAYRRGQVLAELHTATKRILPLLPATRRLRLREVSDWPFEPSGQTLLQGLDNGRAIDAHLEKWLRDVVAEVNSRLHAHAPTDETVIHFDFHYRNVLISQRSVAVLDFDFAHVDEPVADLATALAFLPNREAAAAFISGYCDRTPLSLSDHAVIPTLYDARKLLHAGWLLTWPEGQDVEQGLRDVLSELGSCPL